jgi:hypothetical protein
LSPGWPSPPCPQPTVPSHSRPRIWVHLIADVLEQLEPVWTDTGKFEDVIDGCIGFALSN